MRRAHSRARTNKEHVGPHPEEPRGGVSKDGPEGKGEREGAALGVFLTLNDPTREMEKEAASVGFYETGGRKFLKLQILTAAQVIDGKRPQVPFGHTESLKKASRESEDKRARLL